MGGFKDWLSHRYAKSNVPSLFSRCKKYNYILFEDIREIDKVSHKNKNSIVKSLIVLSKYLGVHAEFKRSLKNYGVKLFRQDAFSSFMRGYNNQNLYLNEWLQQALEMLRPSEQVYLQ